MAVIATTLIQEVSSSYQHNKSGQLDVAAYFTRALSALPTSAQHLLARYGLTDMSGIQARLTRGAAQISQTLAGSAITVGQNTLQFVIGFGVMLYLMFFALRDGRQIGR